MQVQPEPVLKDEHAPAGLRMTAGAAEEGEGNQYALHVRYSKCQRGLLLLFIWPFQAIYNFIGE